MPSLRAACRRKLENCGLVRSKKLGRACTYSLCALQPLQEAERLAFSSSATQWEQRLDQLDDFLTTLKEQT